MHATSLPLDGSSGSGPGTDTRCEKVHCQALKPGSPQPELHAAFSAAYDGCDICVAKALDSGKVLVNQRSDTSAFDLWQWAIWGQDKGLKDTSKVQDLLKRRGAIVPEKGKDDVGSTSLPSERKVVFVKATDSAGPATLASLSVGQERAAGHTGQKATQGAAGRAQRPLADHGAHQTDKERTRIHDKARAPHHNGQPHLFFSAAYAGCEVCVRRYVEQDRVDPTVTSESGRANAMLWAVYGQRKGHNTAWVRGFLYGRGLPYPQKKSRETVDTAQPASAGAHQTSLKREADTGPSYVGQRLYTPLAATIYSP